MDSALVAMAESAESGAEMPGLCLFAGVLSVFGTPVSSAEASDLMRQSMTDAMYESEKRRFGRGRSETLTEAGHMAAHYLGHFGPALASDSGALSLKEAVMVVTTTSEKISVPVVRVGLDSISSWFVGDFKSSGGGSGGVCSAL